jgi:hypothetical protein
VELQMMSEKAKTKLEAQIEKLEEKKKNKPKATRKQKIVAAVIIPISAVLVATAIASPNNNHRDTAPTPPADTSHHATAQKKGTVKFNGESPDVGKALDKLREVSEDKSLGKNEQIAQAVSLAKDVTVSTDLLNQYMGSTAILVRDGRMEDEFDDYMRLIQIFRAEVVKNKMKGTTEADFATRFSEVVKEYYRDTAQYNQSSVDENMSVMQHELPNISW